MHERPILFSAPMVRAILDGRKTQTRRVAKVPPARPIILPLRHPPKHEGPYFDSYCSERKTPENPRGMSNQWCWWTADDRPDPLSTIRCPYGAPGDRLWVKETHVYRHKHNKVYYRADWGNTDPYAHNGWRPSIFMRREWSRITLEITGVRIERLQEISEEDARSEGVMFGELQDAIINGEPGRACFFNARDAFAYLWAGINGAESWKANPWVWVVEFKVMGERREAKEGV